MSARLAHNGKTYRTVPLAETPDDRQRGPWSFASIDRLMRQRPDARTLKTRAGK